MAEAAGPSVLFVDQSGEVGGAELSLLDLVRCRREGGVQGDTVALLSPGPFEDRLKQASITTRVLPLAVDVQKASGSWQQLAAGPRVLGTAWKLASLAKQHDLIYANTQKAAVLGCLAAWFGRRPMIWHLRDMLDADHFSEANRRVVIALTNRSTSLVIANSQATADAYRNAGGRVETVVVHNGVDSAPFEATTDDAARAARLSIGVPATHPLVGVFGRLAPWKGQHILLEALTHESLQEVQAIVVGEALFTAEDRAYAEKLRQHSIEPPLAGRVRWLGHREDVPTLMRACDVIVHSATQPEPFGRVIVEGQLAGRPVVATNAGGAAEIVRDGENGLLTTPGETAELAEAIGGLLKMPEEAAQLAQRGLADARQRFGLEACVARVNELIAGVVSK